MLGDKDSALDAMQEVFLRLLNNHPSEIEYPTSYLFTAATRICLDKINLAENRYRENNELLATIASSEDIEKTFQVKRIIDWIFHRQPQSTKVMAVLHYVDGLTYSEISEVVEISAAGVRRRLENLKTHIAQKGGNAWEKKSNSQSLMGKDS